MHVHDHVGRWRFLVIGHTKELENTAKSRSFELLRRHLHGLEILTFHELLTRAEELVGFETRDQAATATT
jgi:hypothetical protein